MAIRLPLRTVASFSDDAEVGAGSVAGGVQHPFQLLQDTDSVVVKFTASIVGAVSAVLQTTDDGGTTFYDVARTSVVSNANNTTAQWLAAPVMSAGINPIVNSNANAGSILGGTIGSAAASTLGSREVSGLPILSQQARVFIRITGNVTAAAANNIRTTVYVNSQAAIS